MSTSRAHVLALTIAGACSLVAAPARAEEDEDERPVEQQPPAAEPAPEDDTDWTTAPRPDQASGVARPDARSVKDRLLWIPRAILFVPRWVVWGVGQPIRGAAYAYEKYNLTSRFQDAVFNPERTFGIYPVIEYDTSFGFTAGARLVHRDLFGARERMKLRVDLGGRFRQAYGINVRSGDRLGEHVALELDTSYERRPLERFYGIGNGDKVEVKPTMPIDPLYDPTAYPTRFRETIVRNKLTVDARIAGRLRNRVSGALMLRDFAGTGEADSLDFVYRAENLVGWTTGVDNLYLENELVYDSRRPASPYQSEALDGAGWLASVHVGKTFGIAGDPSDFFTYGGEVQKFFDLYEGSRILALRLMVEAVGGTNARDGKISFIDLPRLGGSDYLRGYPNARFRDRAVTLASAEYLWDLGNFLGAYTFVDVGRPWRELSDLEPEEADSLRIGFGGGVQIHTAKSFLTRLQIAGSRDGDVLLELALSPAFGRRERAGRF